MTKKSPGEILEGAMKRNALTITDVAEATGLSPAAIRRALRNQGQRSRSTVRRITAGSKMDEDEALAFARSAGHSPAVLGREDERCRCCGQLLPRAGAVG